VHINDAAYMKKANLAQHVIRDEMEAYHTSTMPTAFPYEASMEPQSTASGSTLASTLHNCLQAYYSNRFRVICIAEQHETTAHGHAKQFLLMMISTQKESPCVQNKRRERPLCSAPSPTGMQ
jgi:hypothetical protein